MQSSRRGWTWAFPIFFLALWIWAAIDPVDRFDWFLENLLIFLGVPVLIWLDRKRPFTTLSLALLTLFLSLHVTGSHWSYSNVPGPWYSAGEGPIDHFFSMGLGAGRNYFDRIVHFLYGLLLAPVAAEVIAAWGFTTRRLAWFFVVMGVLATSAIYEIVEMVAAVLVNPALADAFLGQQGDQFDAVKDMTMAWIGSLFAVAVVAMTTVVSRRAQPSN